MEPADSVAADGLLSVIEHLLKSRRPDVRIVRRYAGATEHQLGVAIRTSLPYPAALHVKLLIARARLKRWMANHKRAALADAIVGFTDALLVLSNDKTLQLEQRAATIATASAFGDVVAKPRHVTQNLNAKRSSIEGVKQAPWSSVMLLSEDELRGIIRALRLVLDPPPLTQLAELGPPEEAAPESTASLLLRASQEKPVAPPGDDGQLEADLSQSKVKITRVALTNFRGIGSEVTIGFRRGSRPVSALIYGDNGVGKSSLADGIEFALQGRVGRSQDFNSTFAPVLSNLASDESATAVVDLSDGTSIERRLILNRDRRSSAAGAPISPGFRWAPVTLKRSDILRFLESDPLSRGTVFFDYFPGDAERMGTRPEEQVVTLEDRLFGLKVRRQALSVDLAARLGIALDRVDTPDALARTISDEFFDGADIGEAVADGRWEAVDSGLRSLITSLQTAMADYRRTKNRIDRAVNVLNPKEYEKEARQLRATATDVGAELTASFLKVTKADYIGSINVLAGETGPVSLDIVIELKNGRRVFPQQIFSEGYRDLLALLFFLAVAHSSTRRGQAKVLVLDDVIQSVDAGVRLGLMAHVLDRFADWQLILTLHDGMWYQQLRALMRRRGHQFVEHRLVGWTFGGGPQLSSNLPGLLSGIDGALAAEDPGLAAAAAGRLLEQLSAEESWRLRISVHRARDDKYTLGDLWPGLVKALKRSPVAELMKDIDDASELRNLLGAHFNDYAEAVSWEEVRTFAGNVRRLAGRLHCEECGEWVSAIDDTRAACACGHTSLPLR